MKFFKRGKAKPEHFWVLPTPPLLPDCPVHGDRCGFVRNPFGPGYLRDYNPCPALEAAIERVDWNQRHEYFWNPQSGNFEAYEI
jgi:hypothetical protein